MEPTPPSWWEKCRPLNRSPNWESLNLCYSQIRICPTRTLALQIWKNELESQDMIWFISSTTSHQTRRFILNHLISSRHCPSTQDHPPHLLHPSLGWKGAPMPTKNNWLETSRFTFKYWNWLVNVRDLSHTEWWICSFLVVAWELPLSGGTVLKGD